MTETTSTALPEEVCERVARELGAGRTEMLTGERFRVGGEERRVVAAPESVQELVELMRLAFAESWRVVPAGSGTWLGMGNPSAGFELIISTTRLDRLLEYEPADLTATVEAGLPLANFNTVAREHGQWIPLDPFGSPASTIGATVSTGSYGPLRCGYGTPRDWLIGLQVAHIDGKLSRAGGKVVKNVAGYDLCKLYTGSHGTLVIITEMSFKLRSIAPAERTLVFKGDRVEDLIGLAESLRQSSLQPVAMEIMTPQSVKLGAVDSNRGALALRFLHEPEAINSQIEEALRIGEQLDPTVLNPTEAAEFWTAYQTSETDPRLAASLLLSFLPADLGRAFGSAREQFPELCARAHAANGTLRIHLKADEPVDVRRLLALRESLEAVGGRMVLTHADEQLRRQVDTWGRAGQTGPLMQAIKRAYDPRSLLNPGRFVNGI